MNSQATEGVVLTSIDFDDYSRIGTIFSLDYGVIKLFFKGVNHKSNPYKELVVPFSRCEYVFSKTRSELYRFHEGIVIDHNLELRQKVDFLQTACAINNAIIRSQLVEKASPLLYQLFVYYLKKIPFSSIPRYLFLSFLLKLLRHDGILSLQSNCSVCQKVLDTTYIAQGECFCFHHVPSWNIKFTEEEMLVMLNLVFSKSFSQINKIPFIDGLDEKINMLFCSLYD